MMTCDTCSVNHVVRNPGGFHLCILKAIKNCAFAHSCHDYQSYLDWHYQIAMYSGCFVQSVYKVVKCLCGNMSLCGQDIEQTLIGVVD